MAAEPWFSCELEGSKASLLGTGVVFDGFLLDLVVSLRHEGVGEEVGTGEALAKNPRMLCCCLPEVADDDIEPAFLDPEGVFPAGVCVPAIFQGFLFFPFPIIYYLLPPYPFTRREKG